MGLEERERGREGSEHLKLINPTFYFSYQTYIRNNFKALHEYYLKCFSIIHDMKYIYTVVFLYGE